ncbi:hypothetical protein AC1031_008428 [Aphanomyces cochlioides]|nr:hypothetical protein AC1031_008428 [Aphanomyces cochlioides]
MKRASTAKQGKQKRQRANQIKQEEETKASDFFAEIHAMREQLGVRPSSAMGSNAVLTQEQTVV